MYESHAKVKNSKCKHAEMIYNHLQATVNRAFKTTF